MRILGIDPGLITTGFGVVDVAVTGKVVVIDAGTIKPNPKDAFERRLFKIHQHLNTILTTHRPEVVVLEKLYAHHKHPTTASILGHARGVICLCVAQHNTLLVEQSVKRIRKALLGNGNATKPQVQEFIKRLLKLNVKHMPLDTSDALGLALGHAHMMRYKLL